MQMFYCWQINDKWHGYWMVGRAGNILETLLENQFREAIGMLDVFDLDNDGSIVKRGVDCAENYLALDSHR